MLTGLFMIILFISSVEFTFGQLEIELKNVTTRNKEKYSFVAKIEKGGKQVCTCVLVDSKVAITLKSCINGPLSDFKVRVQDARSGKFTSTKIQRTMKLTKDENVILIELDKKFQNINTPPFNRFSIERKPFCKAVGFSTNGKVLREVKINTESSRKCLGTRKKNYLCFDVAYGASLCQTSNASPILCYYDNKWFLSGLSFINKGCKRKGINGINLSYLRQSITKAIKKMNTDGLCLTSGCVLAASRALEAMDTDVNPCDSFYDFACGKWVKMNSIPFDSLSYSTNREMHESNMMLLKSKLEEDIVPSDIQAVVKAKEFYTSCKDKEKIEELGNGPLHAYMESMGGLPMLGDGPGGRWDSKAYSLENLIVKSFHMTPSTPIIKLFIRDSQISKDRYEIEIDQPQMAYYLTGNDYKILFAYQTYLEETYQAFGANKSVAAAYAKDILNLEVDIAKSLLPFGEGGVEYLPVETFSEQYKTKLNVTKIVEGLYESGGFPLDTSKRIWVYSIEYLFRLDNITRNYSESVIASYIVSQIALSQMYFLPKIYTDIFDRFAQVFGLPSISTPSWLFCVDTLVERMPFVIGRLFIDEAFLEDEQTYMLDLAKRHKNVFKGMLRKQSWVSKNLKKILVEKAAKMKIEAGYPKFVRNDTALNEIHKQFTVFADNPLKSLESLADAEMLRAVEFLTRDFDDDPWTDSPVNVNAYYFHQLNAVVLLADYFQPRRYSHDMPEYMNYGGAGVVTGHEISHGFDNKGRFFTGTGEFNPNLWPPKDVDSYNKRASCFVEQFNNYTVPGTGGMKHNGILTIDENLADNGGLRIGFEAYRKWVMRDRKGKEENRLPGLPYTPDQLFFLNYAQTRCYIATSEFKKSWIQTARHSLPRFRVTGMMQNSKDFAKAWNCPTGSYMNPANKCSMFY